MDGKAIINLLSDRPVAYHPDMARILGSVKCAIFTCQLLYWTGKGARKDGYIWKTQKDITQETGLSRCEQETARRHLVEMGVLEEKLAGIPARLHYRLDVEKLQASVQEYYEQDCGEVADSDVEEQQSIPEITQENTTEISSNDEKEASPPGETVDVDTPECRDMFAQLTANAKAKGRRGPKRFPSLEVKRKFITAATELDGEFKQAMDKAFEQGITSVVGITNYVAKWAANNRKAARPKHITLSR